MINRDIHNQYKITVRNKFDILQDKSEADTSNNEYENFFTVLIEAAAECTPIKPGGKYRVPMETIVVRKYEKHKKAFLLNKRNPTNANAHKIQTLHCELMN